MMKIARSILPLALLATTFAACTSPLDLSVDDREVTYNIKSVILELPFYEFVGDGFAMREGPLAMPWVVDSGTVIAAIGVIREEGGSKTISLSIDLQYEDHELFYPIDPYYPEERVVGLNVEIKDLPITIDTVEDGGVTFLDSVFFDPYSGGGYPENLECVRASMHIKSPYEIKPEEAFDASSFNTIRFVEVVDTIKSERRIYGVIYLMTGRPSYDGLSFRMNQLIGVISVPEGITEP